MMLPSVIFAAMSLSMAASASHVDFDAWCTLHEKVFANPAARMQAEVAFRTNVVVVDALNAESAGTSCTFTLNKFADLTPAEFKDTVLMPRRPSPAMDTRRYAPPLIAAAALPIEFDWRLHNAVTPVRDQGTVGSCWAFSTVENIESMWFLAGHNLTQLSVEMLSDCDNSTDPATGHADCGVFGGWPYLAYDWLRRDGGIMLDADYPYCEGTGACFPCPAPGYNKSLCGPPVPSCEKKDSCTAKRDSAKFVPGLAVLDWLAIMPNETVPFIARQLVFNASVWQEMAAQLVAKGPLSILIDASTLQFYHKGVWDPKICSQTETDHAVQLTGYGVDPESSLPYWVVRNSWGAKWGDNGYFQMARGTNLCGITTGVTTSVLAQTT